MDALLRGGGGGARIFSVLLRLYSVFFQFTLCYKENNIPQDIYISTFPKICEYVLHDKGELMVIDKINVNWLTLK